jgi:hypothetical protein
MNLVIKGFGSDPAQSATFKITNHTQYPGFGGNLVAKVTNTTVVNEGMDFSFAANTDLLEAEGSAYDGDMRVPIYCRDYGAWCEVEITLKYDGEAVGEPFKITVPTDLSEDRMADSWQLGQINRWNDQFRLDVEDEDWIDREDFATWPRAFATGTGAELADSDGDDGPLPAMVDKGDDLPALVEYRGFFLDGGPRTTVPNHHRLSVAVKELLVECSEMPGIASTTLRLPPEGAFTDQGNDPNANAQGYSLTDRMSAVSTFFNKQGPATGNNPKHYPGAALDTWWVKDTLNDMGYVVYENGAMGTTHKYSGPYKDLQRPNDSTRDRIGWLSIASDHNLAISDPESFSNLYGGNQQGNGGGQGVAVLGIYGNRNNQCAHFIKLAVQGRNEAAREQDERLEIRKTHQGAAIFVNSLSEEPDLVNQATFEGRLEWSIAHELAHLFVGNDDDHFDGVGNVLSTSLGAGLSSFVEEEIANTKLRQRASINRDANGNPQP